MNDWNEKPSELAALLDEARADVPDAARLERVRERIETEIGVALAPRAKATVGFLPGVIGGIAVVGVVAWLLWPAAEAPVEAGAVEGIGETESEAETEIETESEAENEHEHEHEHEHETEHETEHEHETVSAAEHEAETAAEHGAVAGAEDEAVAEAAAGDEASRLREEIALLERAMAARDRGDADEARSVLATHRSRFPEGVLRPERERMLRELDAATEGVDPLPDP